MRVCLNCGAEVSPAGLCVNCGARVCFPDSSNDGSRITESMEPPDKLVLLRDGRKVSGVCVGIARRFGLPIWLVRTLFIIPGAFWLIGPITYVVLVVSLDEWPPSAPRLAEKKSEYLSTILARHEKSARKWTTILWVLIGSLAAWLIAGIVSESFRTVFLVSLMFFCFCAIFPVGLISAFAWLRVASTKKAAAQRLVDEKDANRICIRCHESLPATASVCSSCGCEDLQVVTR